MKTTPTLSFYIARIYAQNVLLACLILVGIVYLFDMVELLRRTARLDAAIPLAHVFEMGLYKVPEVGQIILPFAVLFSAIFTFWLLNRRHELVVVRAAGFSVWQFLAPVMGVAALVGVAQIGVINPVGAVMLAKYERMESDIFSPGGTNLVTMFGKGLWLRQKFSQEGVSGGMERDYVILHARRVGLPSWEMRNVMALFFSQEDTFLKRIDAEKATLEDGALVFEQAQIHTPGRQSARQDRLSLPSRLTPGEIAESFATPMTQPFWRLPSYIQTLRDAGFDVTGLRIHFHSLLARPILFMAMVLLAATVSLRPPRSHGIFMLVTGGILAGFLVFFVSSFLQALGLTHQIPVLLAAWSPAVVVLLLGMTAILRLEDG